ncbi:MAG: GNAT family N-acetyltransferase, partial [Myxococcales bacterium]|nr:GNAT family N-acetyltransferase [Myxococcales bacterium]
GLELDGVVVSVAYSPWQSEAHADLSIDTRPEHRRRGLATRVAATLVRRLADEGRTAVWGTPDDNHASLALSERLGFAPVGMLWVSEPTGTGAELDLG